MKSFNFWYKFLLFFSFIFSIQGVVIALFPNGIMLAPHSATLAETFYSGTIPDDAARMREFLLGPVGGTIAGYFLMQTFIVWGPFKKKEKWAWHAVLWPLLLWFTVDSSMSTLHGALFNVLMINIWTLVAIGLPLIMTYKHFFKKENNK